MITKKRFVLQIFCLVLFALAIKSNARANVYNVVKYGAVSDGKTDCTEAFLKAWEDACTSNGGGTILVPKGKFLIGPVVFKGECKGLMEFKNQGRVLATTDLSDYKDDWISFQYLNGLKVKGRGIFNGQGSATWRNNDFKTNANSKMPPISIRIDYVTSATIEGITSVDSKGFHINILGSKNVNFNSVTIKAPGDSPNTDGIHMGDSNSINIINSNIATGDDCISIGAGTSNIFVYNVTCGPGHGISIGSLGKYPNEDKVEGLTVRNCTFVGTQNGVRIKTWAPSPPNLVHNITYEGIYMDNVQNPIIVDQEYCPSGNCGNQDPSRVQIKDVHYRDIWGTSALKVAVNFLCSKSAPCQNVELNQIYLQYQGNDGPATANCVNVQGVATGKVIPPSCLT